MMKISLSHARFFLLNCGALCLLLLAFPAYAIESMQPANYVVGQDNGLTGSPQPIFVKGTIHNAAHKLGFSSPTYGLALDPTDHRLFFSDVGNNRILVYNLNASNNLIDRIPDNVLGQTNFWASSSAVTQSGISSPAGLAFDDANNRLFVAENNINHVKVFDVTSITDGENAINVLGHNSFTSSAAASTQTGMNGPVGVAYDSANQRLFVSQQAGNRVTTYNLADGLSDGEAATSVLGQANFTAATAVANQAGMSGTIDIAYDSAGTRLFVSQGTPNRVTVYDVASITNGENAVSVLGQTNFANTTAATTQAGMNGPRGLAYDSVNNFLYVSQATANRVTVYDVASIGNGENAVSVLGQANFTTATAATTQAGLNVPNGILIDTGNSRLYVTQNSNNRISIFDVATITNGENAVDLLGQYDDSLSTPGPLYTKATANNGPHKLGMNAPSDAVIDATNDRLFVADTTNNRVLVYNLTASHAPVDLIPDAVLGQTNYYSNATDTSQTGLSAPYALAYDSINNYLFVADTTNNRIVVYDTASITDGEAAVNVLGQLDFVSNGTATKDDASLSAPRQLAYDSTSRMLYVADSGNHRIMVFDVTYVADSESAVYALGQDDGLVSAPTPVFTKSTTSNAPHKLGFNIGAQSGFAIDPTDHRLFVSDTTNNRILVYNLNSSNVLLDRTPDNVLGQTSFWAASTSTTSQSVLQTPTGLVFDDANNRLFVAENTPNRVKVYDVTTITDGEDAMNVLGQKSFIATSAATTQVGLNAPSDVAYDSANKRLFVAENTSNRVKIYNLNTATVPNGMNAESAVGQTDGTLVAPEPIFVKSTAHNGPNQLGLDSPVSGDSPVIGMALDASAHRLFLSDTGNNRILVYNLDTNNALIDRIPDAVLGQSNYYVGTASSTQSGLETPNGLALSGSTILFVAESAGSRVKVFDVTSITNGENAWRVLGQTSFTGTTPSLTQKGMSAPTGVFFDAAHARLFVTDSSYHRVTIYDLRYGVQANGTPATSVLGQASFTSSTNATTQAGMNVPFDVSYDSANQRLFVSEGSNNRVVVYDVTSITNGENAINVLGQANFTTATAATTQAGMNAPRALTYDSSTNRLYVCQSIPNRVTIYDVASITNGENAINVLGQATFTAATINNTQAGMNAPQGVLVDRANNRLYVGQSGSRRVSIFDDASISDGENAIDLLGQYDDSLSAPSPIFTKTAANNGPSKLGLSAPIIGLALDPTDNRLFVSDTGNNRVLVYNLDSNKQLADQFPDNVLGQANFYSNAAATTQAGMNVPNGLVFDDANNRLFVAQGTGNRVTIYDVTSISDGENAVNVLGQSTFTGTTAATTQAGMNVPYDVSYDSANQRLFVSEGSNNRVVVYDVTSITDGENAINVLGQANFTTATAATTQAGMNAPRGLAYDSANSRLYVAQATGNRVTTYDLTTITDGENAINVLGQTLFTATTAASTQAGMNVPSDVAYDSTNQRLYVSQTSGNRITMYDVSTITDGKNASTVFGQIDFTSNTSATSRFNLSSPTGVFSDPARDRLYVLESSNNRLVTYLTTEKVSNGLPGSNVLGQANFTTATPATSLAGMNVPRGLAYDSSNSRLYVSQSTGNRVTVYDVTAITDGESAVNVLGQTKFTATAAATTQAGMNDPRGLCLNSANTRLFVSQLTGNRVTVFDVATVTDGEAAINVLGEPDFTSSTATIKQAGLSGPAGCIVDANNQLYVAQTTAHRASIFDIASIGDGENAVDMLGQYDSDINPPGPIYTKGTANNAPYKLGLSSPSGVAVDPTQHRLFVADTSNNRVLVYNLSNSNLLTDVIPDYVLGQPTFWQNATATTQSGFSSPIAVAADPTNNYLFVSDQTNNRIMIYDTASISDGEDAIGIIGQSTFTSATAATSQSGLSSPRNISFDTDSKQLLVADNTNNRVLIFPTEQATTSGGGDSFHFFGF